MAKLSTNILNTGLLADLVRKTREEKGMSYKKVAEASGGDISNGYVWHIETKTVKPADLTLKKLIALAEGLGLPASEVVNAALQDALDTHVSIIARVPSFKANQNDAEQSNQIQKPSRRRPNRGGK